MGSLTLVVLTIIAITGIATCQTQQPFYKLKPAQPAGINLNCPPYNVPPICGGAGQVPCSNFNDFVEARFQLGNHPRDDNSLPTWFNVSLALQGQDFSSAWGYNNVLALILGFGAFSSVPDARDVLLNTGETVLSPNAVPAALAAFAQVQVWLSDTFNRTNGSPVPPTDIDNSSMLRSLKRIRQIHTAAMTKVSNFFKNNNQQMFDPTMYTQANASIDWAFWNAMIADLNASPIPAWQRQPSPAFTNPNNLTVRIFNQQTMTLVLFNLGLYPVLLPTTIGIAACDQDLYSFYHLWAMIGFALGMDDKYNPGLQPDLPSGRQMLADIFNGYVIPALFNMDWRTFVFLEGNINAVNQVLPIYTKGVGMTYFLQDFLGIQAPNTYARLSLLDKTTYNVIKTSTIPRLMTDAVYRLGLNTAANEALTTQGLLRFGTDFATTPGRANSCYKTNLDEADYQNGDEFDQNYPDYAIEG